MSDAKLDDNLVKELNFLQVVRCLGARAMAEAIETEEDWNQVDAEIRAVYEELESLKAENRRLREQLQSSLLHGWRSHIGSFFKNA